jgi:NRAMP (natural resistance-associated macrophage protein)-like metal ion transporter
MERVWRGLEILRGQGGRGASRPSWLRYLALLGPGIIAANAGNDAAGVTTYAVVGARYGYSLLWMLVLITVSMGVVQEMCARMGAITGKGLSDLIREQFGVRWTAFAMLIILVANAGTIVAEFAGIAAAMELFDISRWISAPLAAVLVLLLVTRGSYHRVERIFLALTTVFLTYVVAAFLARPDWGEVFRSTLIPTWHWESGFIFMFVATVGTTIAPWMQFLLQSTIVDKGITSADLKFQRFEAILGVVLSDTVSFFIIVATAATLFIQGIQVETAEDAAKALAPIAGPYASALFAIGLLGASLIGACVLPITTAFSITEAFGWENGLDRDFREARVFYGLITGLVVAAALIVLIPGLPLVQLLLLTSAVNGVLLPVELFFIMRLINDRELMGANVNGPVFNAIAWATTIVISILSVILLVVSLVLPLFGIQLGG